MGFKGALVLAAGLAGCGNTYITNNYYGTQDGGAPAPVADMAQAPTPDMAKCTPQAPTCIALNNLKADNGTYIITDVQTGNTYTQKVTVTNNMDGSTAYYAEFYDANGNGIPICSQPDINRSFANCATTDSNYVPSHKVQVQFLGDKYIISGMTLEMSGADELILAKESVSGIVNTGESLPLDNCLTLHLDDLEATGNVTAAIISVRDANGNVLLEDTISPGTTATETINGQQYKIHVNKVAPGYTFGARWADIAVFSKETVLDSGQDMQLNGQIQAGFKVKLVYDTQGRLLSLDVNVPPGATNICE